MWSTEFVGADFLELVADRSRYLSSCNFIALRIISPGVSFRRQQGQIRTGREVSSEELEDTWVVVAVEMGDVLMMSDFMQQSSQ
mmetsp:Transcript_13835/g.13915  ORF Transcript_13835/g.13915 Transcript_13835/m.13915 type:complete len:84 (-) Transcript_13835:404-655(-)|eukprot:CAMPEP_0182429004 /NCGR_PEP_ID=MMETSP1167-20130531/25397_1 /TAXON_ID=2988 /ORGANISM="Mallomonas Sp, Strain CCMP3275" /LENGTH=83 /DNA_ID=CAMNT_0024612293 /DNA_START=669 /DNA_END=920 /DNA_ORIENTATION=-